jgi:glutamate N-acetyltransferase/amino-acid N-acetyltransferase
VAARVRGVRGFRAAGLHCGIKPDGAPDLALILSDRPATAAGVFTQSRFPGAPVVLTRRHIRSGQARAIVTTSGNANVATGAAGRRDAESIASAVARGADLRPRDVLVAATGVIGRRLPMDRVRDGVPRVVGKLSTTGWRSAARAILTTDTRPKLAVQESRGFTVLGMAKGAGMMMPNMATLLAFVVTDLAVAPAFLRRTVREVADDTLNRLTIDGETSTSDMLLVLANGAAASRPIASPRGKGASFVRALRSVCASLAEDLARDGEGVTRIAEVRVEGARSRADAERLVRAVANSVLVKTALFGADPNWGRIVQAAGVAGAALDPARLGVRIGGVDVLRRGTPVGGADTLRQAERAMRKPRVEIVLRLGLGAGRARLLTTDLSYEYVRINAEYTT